MFLDGEQRYKYTRIAGKCDSHIQCSLKLVLVMSYRYAHSTIEAVTKCSTERSKGQAFDIILDAVVILMALVIS